MTYAEALHIAKVVKGFSYDTEIHKDRAYILELAKELSTVYTAGVEMATAKYILERANADQPKPVNLSFLR